MRVACLLVAVWVSVTTAQTSRPRELYVSPAGNDRNPGTEASPLQSISAARDRVRQLKATAQGPLIVNLSGGTYTLREPLAFSEQDSGSPGRPIIYRRQGDRTPVVSGGVRITGWAQSGPGLWKARTSLDDFRQLYVNGRRAIRARSPVPAGIRNEGRSSFFTTDGSLARWRNPKDVELVFDIQWQRNILKVRSLEAAGNGTRIDMVEPRFTMGRLKQGKQIDLPTHIENALELLDEPGEWYLDRAAREVYYMPRSGENIENVDAIAPALETLLEIRGTLDRPVHDLRFEGITFSHGSWLQPSRIGHVDLQANFTLSLANLLIRIAPGREQAGAGPAFLCPVLEEATRSPANIVLDAAHSVHFERCTFTHLGGAGVDVMHGSQGNVISGSRFNDIAGSAIQIGDVNDHHPSDLRAVVKNNQVSNCYIADVANQYLAGVGIFAGYTEGTLLAHNEITQLPYSGISVGWGWGELDAGGGAYYQPKIFDTPTVSRNNRIEFNHIHDVTGLLWDGAGIYTLGNMPGTVIRGNHVHDNPGWPGGIYLDEGSGFIEVTGNLVYNVKPLGRHAATPMNFNNRNQNRIATCNVHDNNFSANKPDGAAFAAAVAEKAGLEPAYRDIARLATK